MSSDDWISVKVRLPDSPVRVWATNGVAQFESCFFHGKWTNGRWITHWMPLPDLPKYEIPGDC